MWKGDILLGKTCNCGSSNNIGTRIQKIRGANLHSLKATRSVRVLAPGETIYLTCRFVGVAYHLRLSRGQYVDVSCGGSPNIVRVGCASLQRRLPPIHLKAGDVLMFSCS